ncbi:unnamed protein product [Kuraishia capsulata CBS 1993]|uniref:Mitochondrial inner membrane protease ATP23 n=1 Tax=Kuraishia capsulata CBS 1993 TaxID=1382522 RepID=W6MMD8_9ASCO|nr:uncharacterized protein KUCA_T00003728001 [Kuraishia capsulata CBS 1993]CDK27749.1 unnamed protein product [Kuraishia capsulata CBS 1993]
MSDNTDSNKPSTFDWWRRTMEYKTGMGLTPESKEAYEKDLAVRTKTKDCEKCYEYRDWMLTYSPSVVFMLDQIKKLGSKLDSKDIICDECDDLRGGGYHPDMGILLCQNRILDKWHLGDVLSHELVHAYDDRKFKVDWLNLKHHACSEIRASSLSGECRISQEFWKGALGKVSKGHQNCVKRRAVLSVMANPNCDSRETAEKAVDEVWASCFNDPRPYEMIYR